MHGPTCVVWANLTHFSLKIVRLVRAFRLLKLLRLVRIKRILDRWEEEMYGRRALRVGKIVFLVGVASHWICCGWFFVGDTTPRNVTDYGGTIVQGWASEYYPKELRGGHAEAGPEFATYTEMYFTAWCTSAENCTGLAQSVGQL